jgi:hypothetical protein
VLQSLLSFPSLIRSARLALLACALGGCAAEATECVTGDQIQCRCGDDSYGYRTCDATGQFSGACDCILGLRPDAGSFMGSMSGQGQGTTPRDGGR